MFYVIEANVNLFSLYGAEADSILVDFEVAQSLLSNNVRSYHKIV